MLWLENKRLAVIRRRISRRMVSICRIYTQTSYVWVGFLVHVKKRRRIIEGKQKEKDVGAAAPSSGSSHIFQRLEYGRRAGTQENKQKEGTLLHHLGVCLEQQPLAHVCLNGTASARRNTSQHQSSSKTPAAAASAHRSEEMSKRNAGSTRTSPLQGGKEKP